MGGGGGKEGRGGGFSVAVTVVWEMRSGSGSPAPEGEPGQEEGRLELRGGTGEVPEPWPPQLLSRAKPQGLKHAHTPPTRNLYTER